MVFLQVILICTEAELNIKLYCLLLLKAVWHYKKINKKLGIMTSKRC